MYFLVVHRLIEWIKEQKNVTIHITLYCDTFNSRGLFTLFLRNFLPQVQDTTMQASWNQACDKQRFGDRIQILEDLTGQVTKIKSFSFRVSFISSRFSRGLDRSSWKAAVLIAQPSASRMLCLVYCTQTVFVAWTETVERGVPGPEYSIFCLLQ